MWENFNKNDYPGAVCCAVLEYLSANGFKLPFTQVFAVKSGDLLGWAVRLYKNSDRRTMQPIVKDSISLMLAYCPFCGADLIRENDDNNNG